MNFVGSSNSRPSPRSRPGVQSSARGHSRHTGGTKYSLSTVLVWVFFLGKGEPLGGDVCLSPVSAWTASRAGRWDGGTAATECFISLLPGNRAGEAVAFLMQKIREMGFFLEYLQLKDRDKLPVCAWVDLSQWLVLLGAAAPHPSLV